jgi:tRNA-uridine 2-sulfurtransferase
MSSTVFLAMSGGVDSSVAAALLLERGCRVVGVTLRLFDACGAGAQTCCGLEDAADARAVAAALGIEHRVLEHQQAFERLVIEPSAREYAGGRTPNPCILCNEKVKFGTLWEYAMSSGADALATGHHARIVREGRRAELRRGRDASKDQSYVLFALSGEQRLATLLPVGEITKEEVRERARALSLPVAEKEESQDVCFAPSGMPEVVERLIGPQMRGLVRHADGRILGEHGGVHRFTVGQRRGLGIPDSRPLYVLKIDPVSGEVTVGPRELLPVARFAVDRWRWHPEPGRRPQEALVQVRYGQRPAPARLEETPEGMMVEWLAEPRGVTPGQAAVAYGGDTVLGGGWIRGLP